MLSDLSHSAEDPPRTWTTDTTNHPGDNATLRDLSVGTGAGSVHFLSHRKCHHSPDKTLDVLTINFKIYPNNNPHISFI